MRDNTELYTQTVSEDAWTKSSYSGAGTGSDCVELATLVGGRAVRDSKSKSSGMLRFAPEAMAAFLDDVKLGAFDSPA
ncbi:DUF397 domain-containing protein [Streptomyces anulatus]|uniref:DUF397 domain-containing protein n=1 Tax=Streptomyces anulatus TaxID=1892 RepID=UPI003436EBD2